MMGAWRPGTKKNYGCHLDKWMAYCKTENIDFLDPSIGEVLEFLHYCFHQGLAYSSICSIRSALSLIITVNGKPVGQHPYVCQLLRSVYQERPNLPRYSTTWSINKVMEYLKNLGSNDNLSVEFITKKLLMLMAILSGVRGQILQFLDLDFMVKDDSMVNFKIHKLTKTSKPGRHVPDLIFKAYPHDEDLCVLTCLNVYLLKSDVNRKGGV